MKAVRTKNNRSYKDSVFVDLFSEDTRAKENFISLYNALHDTNYTAEDTHIENIKLEKVLYMNFYNDVSCIVNGKIIVLAEHQSTINENMPLRFLEYVARLYEKITKPEDRYARKLKKIPSPEFYIFYNGAQPYQREKILKLSDAFMETDGEIKLELTVKMLNISSGMHNDILKKSKLLNEYSLFVETVRKHLEKDPEKGFTEAIKECIKNDILCEYLKRKSKEVENMLLAEYDYATDIQVQRDEAWNSGKQEGKLEGKLEGEYKGKLETAAQLKRLGVASETIALATGLSIEEIENT